MTITICLEIEDFELFEFIDRKASGFALFRDYTKKDREELKPHKDIILLWLDKIKNGKYKIKK